MLRPSRLIPSISAHAHLYDQHNYADHPLAPMGCAVEMHVTLNKRGAWALHSVSGFYAATLEQLQTNTDATISDMAGQGPSGDIWHRRRCRRCRSEMIKEKSGKGYTRSHAHLTNLKSIDFLQVAEDF